MNKKLLALFIIFIGINIVSFAVEYVILPEFEVNGEKGNLPIEEFYSIVSEKLSKHYTLLKKNEFNNPNIPKIIFHFQIIDKYLFLTIFLEKSNKRLLILNKAFKTNIELEDNIKSIAQLLTYELRDLKYFDLKRGNSLLFYNQINWNKNEENKGRLVIGTEPNARIFINGLMGGIVNEKNRAFSYYYQYSNEKDAKKINRDDYKTLEIKYLEIGRTYNIIIYKFNYYPASFKVKLTKEEPWKEYLMRLKKITLFTENPFLNFDTNKTDFNLGKIKYKESPKYPFAAHYYGFDGKFSVICLVNKEGDVLYAETGKNSYFPYLSTESTIAAEKCKYFTFFYKAKELDYFKVEVTYKFDY